VPKPYAFEPWGLALSEKQTPQVVEKAENPKEQMEGLESSIVLSEEVILFRSIQATLERAAESQSSTLFAFLVHACDLIVGKGQQLPKSATLVCTGDSWNCDRLWHRTLSIGRPTNSKKVNEL
jgi:hypothetical protein